MTVRNSHTEHRTHTDTHSHVDDDEDNDDNIVLSHKSKTRLKPNEIHPHFRTNKIKTIFKQRKRMTSTFRDNIDKLHFYFDTIFTHISTTNIIFCQ